MSVEFRERLLRSRGAADQPMGMIVGCSDAAMTEILGRTGYDFVILDGEHSPNGPAELLPLVRTAQLFGLTPTVRMGERTREYTQKMMDIGMEALIVPRVNDPDDFAAVLNATILPHEGGSRGYCPACHAIGYSRRGWAPYNEHIASGQMVIPQIESRTAVDNIEAIVSTDGIDAILFGPGDMAVDMNVPFDSDPIAAAFEKVAKAAYEHNVAVISPIQVPGDIVNQSSALFVGMDWVNVYADFSRQLLDTKERVKAGIAAKA